MRVDDVYGSGSEVVENFNWITICNNYGLKPWVGTFNYSIPIPYIPTLKYLLDNDLATASPHAQSYNGFIYFNHNGEANFNPAQRTVDALDFYTQYQLKLSKYIVPHWYEFSSVCAPILSNAGCEYISIPMLPDNNYGSTVPWLNRGPYRLNRYGYYGEIRPFYYADTVTISGAQFYDIQIEIKDDGGYEWYPDSDVPATTARGIRHLRRSLNSMVLAQLFTHEDYIRGISVASWNQIIQQVTSNIGEYSPVFTTIDYAAQYVRAKNRVKLLDVVGNQNGAQIYFQANNDMATKCYYFTEQNGQIQYRFVDIPQANGSSIITVGN
jgi:hypothetical protein